MLAEVIAETQKLKMTLAKNVLKVLGETNEVKTLDKLRPTLRDNLKSKQAQNNFEAALALAKHSTAKQQFKELEQSTTVMSQLQITSVLTGKVMIGTRLRLCIQLLQHWNITLHL